VKRQGRVWQWLLGLVSLVIVLLVSQVALPAKASAANFNATDSNYLTSATVINGPDFKHGDTINVQYNLDFGDQELKSGDTITVDLPSNLKAKSVGDTFNVKDAAGNTVGTAEVTNEGQVVVTMNDQLEGKTNDKMTLNLATKYRGDDYGEKDVVFNENNQSTINMVSNDANMSKKGTIQADGTVKWTILVDRREIDMKNVKISDTIGDYQTLIKDISVYDGEWTSNSSYKRRDKISSDKYDVTYHDNGFDLAFKDTVSNLVVIDYYTQIDDESLIHSGYKFRNKAVMTWGGGTSGGSNSEEANGKVSSSTGNGGTGDGNENTQKPDPDPEPTPNPDPDPDPEPEPGDGDGDGGTSVGVEEPDEEDNGTTDTDEGYDKEFPEPEEPDTDTNVNPGENSSSESSNSSSVSSTDDKNEAVTPSESSSTKSSSAKTTSEATDANRAATKPSSAKQVTAKSTPTTTNTDHAQAVTKNQKLPQTNESKTSHQALSLIGGLVAFLTLGTGALIRHWF